MKLTRSGCLHSPSTPGARTLLQIGLGGSVVGRNAEKPAPIVGRRAEGDPTKS